LDITATYRELGHKLSPFGPHYGWDLGADTLIAFTAWRVEIQAGFLFFFVG
jgi:hypothetical protein